MVSLILTKQDMTNSVKRSFKYIRQDLLDILEKYMSIENIDVELNSEDSIDFVMLSEDFSVEINISMDNLYELYNNIPLAPYFYLDGLEESVLRCVSHKEEMTDDAPLYEQVAYDEIEDYDKKFDSLVENVVNPFRKAVKAVIDNY